MNFDQQRTSLKTECRRKVQDLNTERGGALQWGGYTHLDFCYDFTGVYIIWVDSFD